MHSSVWHIRVWWCWRMLLICVFIAHVSSWQNFNLWLCIVFRFSGFFFYTLFKKRQRFVKILRIRATPGGNFYDLTLFLFARDLWNNFLSHTWCWESHRVCHCFPTTDGFWQLVGIFFPNPKDPSFSGKVLIKKTVFFENRKHLYSFRAVDMLHWPGI